MTKKFLTIKGIFLNNNCPECYNKENLHLTFKQEFKEHALYKKLTENFTEELTCKNCNTTIYPVSWTDDIERVVNYQRKAFTPKPSTFKFKRLAWVLFIITGLLIVLVLFYTIGLLNNI